MSSDKYDQLIQSCPKLLSKLRYGFEGMGEGWFVLLRGLCTLIEYEIERLPPELQEQVYAVQIKQKFGGLRFYMEHSTPKIDGAISLAEELSNNICETCGGAAGHKQVGGWITTLCDVHHQTALEDLKERNRKWKEEEAAARKARRQAKKEAQ